ncbi:MAG TPA: hypothetical protein GX707_20350 [Epulopiscium sp.]|nr:hypothetical protein [Candidatus Epulonipiscium sp.]
MRKKPKLLLIIIIFSIVALGVFINKRLPNFKTIVSDSIFEEFQIGQTNVVIGEKRISLENPVLMKGSQLYLPLDFVNKHITSNIFWDEDEQILTITNPKEMIRFKPNKSTYEINYKKHQTDNKIIVQNDIVYIPFKLLEEKYNIIAVYNKETDIIILDDTTIDRLVSIVTQRTAKVRIEPDIKSPILETIYQDDEIMTYGTNEGWTLVRTLGGNIGYVNEKHIEHLKEISKENPKVYEPHPIKKEIKEDIVMVWDQIGKGYNVDFNSSKYRDMQGVNVLSPTWLIFEDTKGNLMDSGNKSYVEKAHAQGYQVWSLMSHNFQNSEWTHEILSSTSNRDRLIEQLVSHVKKYKVDGINIDIENLQQKTGPYWIQFMNELYPIMREQGIYVSTDVYVPSPWTVHYNRAEIAKSVDYFVIMAYDEHWSGSEEAGSVGSLPWVQEAIENTLEEVPEEKIILGVPFYARLWREDFDDAGQLQLSTRALGMSAVRQELKDNKVVPLWDEVLGQYYAEYEKDGGLYKIWLEEEDSMRERVKLVSQYNLGGISGWKLGLESPETWQVISEHIKK